MKFGSKGLEASTIIGIIVAVLVAAIILYLLWLKGVLPFNLGVTEAECTAYFTKACQQGGKFDYDPVKKVACASFGKKFKGYDECFTPGGAGCETFCNLEQK